MKIASKMTENSLPELLWCPNKHSQIELISRRNLAVSFKLVGIQIRKRLISMWGIRTYE